MQLYQHQIEPVKKGIEFMSQKAAHPSIIVAPTAFGKSIAIAKIAETVEGNLLILQPSKELLEQNYEKYIRLGGSAKIYSASFNSKRIGQVTYATIGSIKNIGARFSEMGFSKMIVDECHLYPRESDSMFGKFINDSKISHVLGLTATPLKLQSNVDQFGQNYSKLVMLTNRSAKGNFFKDIISVTQVKQMVDLRYWSKLEYEQYIFDTGKLQYNSTKADFTEESLRKVYESNNLEAKIIQKVIDLKDRRSILVFVPSVEEAIALSRKISGSAVVYSGMPDRDRSRIVTGFKNRTIRVVINVNILSVGFDHPMLDTIIMARPTMSFAWYYQALGRGTRIAAGKTDCLVVDFSGNVKKFGRIEHISFEKEGNKWVLYGENDNQLTGIPLHELGMHKRPGIVSAANVSSSETKMPFGQYKDRPLSKVPRDYLLWMLSPAFKWNNPESKLRKEIEAIVKS